MKSTKEVKFKVGDVIKRTKDSKRTKVRYKIISVASPTHFNVKQIINCIGKPHMVENNYCLSEEYMKDSFIVTSNRTYEIY